MPAIQPALLRQQSALLVEHFNDPPAYIRSLHYLLDYYSERAEHSGQSGRPRPLISTYNVHPPVLRLILQELVPLAHQNPENGFALCDALWKESYLEFCLLASMLLGQMPVISTEKITQRIHIWITPDLEFQLIDAILKHGMARLRHERPQILVNLIQEWINDSRTFYQQLGLRALLPLVKDSKFENLPAFFYMIQSLICNAPSILRPDLLDVLIALSHRSPQETAYFLHQCLTLPNAKDAPWLIRHVVREFPPKIQEGLRQSVRKT